MSTKEKVLEYLKSNKDSYISGSQIAKELGLSRNSVWKAIEELRKGGLNIVAVTNKGYKMIIDENTLSKNQIEEYLSDKLLAENIYVFDSVDSTNQTAKQYAIDGKPNNTVIISNEQTMGKGRRGRSFFSPKDSGIYMSIIVKPNNSTIDKVMLVTSATAVAVCNAIKEVSNCDAKIKWVNDIYIDEKKVCGILTECITNAENMSIDSLIIGIGVNVSTTTSQFPQDIKTKAGAINNINNVIRNKLVALIIENVIDVLNSDNDKMIMEQYKNLSCVIGKRVNVIHDYKNMTVDFSGIAMDINDQGHLIIKTDIGETKELSTGEISIRVV